MNNRKRHRTSSSGASGPTRDFRSLWFGESVSLIGDQISTFVIPTLAVLALHASSTQVGGLNAVATLSYPLLGLFVGVLMDRVRRRPVMVYADLARFLAYASLPLAAYKGWLSLGQLYGVAAIAGIFSVLFDVAYQSYLPTLLTGQALAQGNARLEMSSSTARLIGPTIGGALLQSVGAAGALTANAVSFLGSVLGVLRIRAPELAPHTEPAETPVRKQISEGVRFLWQHPLLRPLTIAAAFRNLGMSAARTVLILFLYRALHLTAGTAGLVFTTGAVAALLGAGVCSWLVQHLGVGRCLLATGAEGAVWLFAPLTLFLPPRPTVLVLMFLSSLWLPVWNATVTTVRQAVTERRLLGRVHATARTINLSAMPLGSLLGGLAAQELSTVLGTRAGLTATLTACAALATLSITQLLSRRIRHLRDYPHRRQEGTRVPTVSPASPPSGADIWILDRLEPVEEAEALRDELEGRNYRTEIVDWDTLTPSCIPPGVVREDGRFEVPRLAVVRSRIVTRCPQDRLAELYTGLGLLEDAGVRLVNNARSFARYENKIRQASVLSSAGLPVPPTRAVRTLQEVDACVVDWQDVVLKPCYGHASIDVVRLRPGGHGSATPDGLGAREHILVWHLLERHGLMCAQQFIPNRGRDLRILVLGRAVAGCYFHVSTAPDGSTRHPLYPYRWAQASLSAETEELALRATEELGFDVASLDLVEGPQGDVVIEVNPTISRWLPIEQTEHDRTPKGITIGFADLLAGLLGSR